MPKHDCQPPLFAGTTVEQTLPQQPTQQKTRADGDCQGSHRFVLDLDPATLGNACLHINQRLASGINNVCGMRRNVGDLVHRLMNTGRNLLDSGMSDISCLVDDSVCIGGSQIHRTRE